MVTIVNKVTGRRIRANRRVLSVLGGNWAILKEEPKKEKKKTPKTLEEEVFDRKGMMDFLKSKGHKGVHLLTNENLKKRYETEIKENG